MTKSRLLTQVRKNPDFIAATRLLDDLEIPWELEPARGTGHPRLRIGAERRLFTVASSPKARSRMGNVAANLKARLAEWGLSS